MFYLEREPVLIKQGPHAACNVIGFDAVADNAEIVLFHPHEGPADLIHATAWGRDWSLAEVAGYVTENDLPDDAGEREEPVTVLVYGQGGADADKVRRRLAQGSAGLVSESSAGGGEREWSRLRGEYESRIEISRASGAVSNRNPLVPDDFNNHGRWRSDR